MNFENIQPKSVVCRQSSMCDAIACERYWFCRHRLGIILRGEKVKEGATLGRIYHKFQELGPGHEQEVRAWVQGQQNALMDRVNKGEDIDGQIARLANLMTELYHKAEVMAQIFREKYPQPSYFKVIGKEIEHTMEWDGLTLGGTIDKLILNEQDDSVWIRDHKSTGRSLAMIFGGLAWSLQARMYRVLMVDYTKKYPNEAINVKGFILDGILKPGIKQCKTDDKNAKDWNCTQEEAYLRRVKIWYSEKMDASILSKSVIFTEPLFPPELIYQLEKMRELQNRPIEPTAFSRDISRKACFAYESQCIYHDLCETDPKQWDSLFETKYKFADVKEDDAQNEENI